MGKTFGIGKSEKDGSRYIYFDYEPAPGIQWSPPRRPTGTHDDIMAWVFREYGLKVWSPQIADVRRRYGIVTAGGQGRPRPEGLEPVEVPVEKETAIVAAFRYFGLLP